MTKRVLTIYPHTRVGNAARLMAEHNIGSLVVIDSNGPVGVFTERDLLSKVIAKARDPEAVLVAEVLSPLVASISPAATLHEAARMMIGRKSRLMVYSDGDLEGILTATDIVRFVETIDPPLDLAGVVSREVVVEFPGTPLDLVIMDMDEKRIGSVLVSDDTMPWGIFTERDLLVKVLPQRKGPHARVGQFVSSPLVTAPADVDGVNAAKIMAAHHIKRLPLVSGEDVVGIVTARDIVEAFAMSGRGNEDRASPQEWSKSKA